MSWLDMQTSLFSCVADNAGTPRTFRQILFSDFGVPHKWFYKKDTWISGATNDISTIIKIRERVIDPKDAKQTLQCYTPAGVYECKKKGSEVLLQKNPILQIDLDNLIDYDIDEVRSAIFNLPFVGFVGKSVSGRGLYALIMINEPESLKEYAEHCFNVLSFYQIPVDKTKGRNYSDLRFVSYDANMLYRENPQPLKIKHFPVKNSPRLIYKTNDSNGLIRWATNEIAEAQPGNRSNTINRVAYTLGGSGQGLLEIQEVIKSLPQYQDEQRKFIECANTSFKIGQSKPLK